MNHFQSLFQHQAWADAALLSTVQSHPPSLTDEWLLKTLHHIVTVQLYFLSRFHDGSFDHARESQAPPSFAHLVQLFCTTHEEELAFVRSLTEHDLGRTFDLPLLKMRFSFSDGLTQVVMHSQNHRGQCLRYLRKHGAETPTLDYILWARDRPAPAWPQL